jgi:hypothetical protein
MTETDTKFIGSSPLRALNVGLALNLKIRAPSTAHLHLRLAHPGLLTRVRANDRSNARVRALEGTSAGSSAISYRALIAFFTPLVALSLL